MKKRTVAVVLSLTMCLSPVCEIYASGFGSPDEAVDPVIIQQDSDIPSVDVVQEAAEQGEAAPDTEIFSSGETMEEVPVQTEEAEEAQIFSSEAADEPETEYAEAPEAFASGTITVNAEQWEAADGYYRLKKAGSAPVVNTQTEAVQTGTLTEDISSEVQEAYSAEIMSENVQEAAEENADDEAMLTEEELNIPEASLTTGYYTSADGLIYVTTLYKGIAHSGYYLFDANGYMVTGQKDIEAGTAGISAAEGMNSYFTAEDKAAVYTEFSGENMTPYTSDLGQQKRKYWLWTGTVFRYYDSVGRYLSVPELDTINKNNGNYTGYYKIDGEYYCLEQDGTPRVGHITLTVGTTSAKYYFQSAQETGGIPGQMFRSGWKTFQGTKGERWCYYNKGAVKKDVGKLLERGVISTRLDTSVKGDKSYLIDNEGYILKSTMQKAANGSYYCTDANGAVYKNKLVRYKGNRYYFGSSGKRAAWTNSWRKCAGASNRYYYFGSTPGMVSEKTGWQKVTNTSGKYLGWFYFNSNGNHYMNKLTSAGYYFTKTGKLGGGIHEIDGKTYFFKQSNEFKRNGKMYKNTLVYYKGDWYYASADGSLKKSGWQQVDGNWYYLSNFCVVKNKFMKKDGVNGYLDSNGKYTTGWVLVSNAQNKVRYIDPSGNGFAKNTSKKIDGLLYYFDSNGYRINDVTNRYSGPYYVEVDKTNCVMTIYNSNKTVPVKSIRVSVGLPGSPTPSGTYVLRRSARWQPLMGPSWGQYGTHVSGAGEGGIFVHSIACSYANSYSLPAGEYLKLGVPASHGCIRTCVADAKWVYEHCNGSTIRIFSGTYKADEAYKGPLGRNALVPLRGAGNFDPTDPEVP